MKKQVIKKLDDRSHVLLRPGMYLGSIKEEERTSFIIRESAQRETFIYIPAILKIFREILDNSIDEAIRTDYKFANEIDIIIKNHKNIIIKDNGRGIPSDKTEDGEYMAELAWTHLKAGSNFEDTEDNMTIGQNGVGAAISHIFSSEFIGETADGTKKVTVKSTDNMQNLEVTSSSSKQKYTKITLTPDFSKFSIDDLSGIYEDLILTDLINLSVTFPKIKFKFNNKIVSVKDFKTYVSLYSDKSEILEVDGLKIAVFDNNEDDFRYTNVINGINVFDGGNPLNWVSSNIVRELHTKLSKKFKSIRNGDIKNKLSMIVFFTKMSNPRFNGQTKSECINTVTDFGKDIEAPNFENFASKIFRNKDIITPITEIYALKQELADKKDLEKLDKKIKKFKSEKYLPSTKTKKYLILAEGDSAVAGLSAVLGREQYSYYALKGKPLNAYDSSHQKFISNVELREIHSIMNSEPHNYVVMGTDMDLDGAHIKVLLLGYFEKYQKGLLEQNRICSLDTPLITAVKNKKLVETFYNMDEYNEFYKNNKSLTYSYYKGLGSWTQDELDEVIRKDGIKKLLNLVEYEDGDRELIDIWLNSKRADDRKEYIIKNDFDLIKI